MNWIIYSLLMYFFGVILYLSIRKAQIQKISSVVYSFWMFAFPFISCFFIALYLRENFSLSIIQLIEVLIASIFFSWLGNFFSQKSILCAPNPGYPLIISKSYVVFTTFVAFFVFHSDLTLKSLVAIFLIISFSAIIILSDRNKKGKLERANFSWFLYSLGAFFCWGFLALISKYLLEQGISVLVLLFYICFIVSLLLLLEIKITKLNLSPKKSDLGILIFIGVSSLFFNLFMQIGYKIAPNPGYVNAFNASSITAVTILSSVLFKDLFSLKKIIGVLGVTAGLLLLII